MLAPYCWLAAWLKSEEGQDLIEYALIIALVVVIAVLGMGLLGGQISLLWSNLGDWMSSKTSVSLT